MHNTLYNVISMLISSVLSTMDIACANVIELIFASVFECPDGNTGVLDGELIQHFPFVNHVFLSRMHLILDSFLLVCVT